MQFPDFYFRNEIWSFQIGQRIMGRMGVGKKGESKGFHSDMLTPSINEKLGL